MSSKRTINGNNGNTFVPNSEKLINGSIVFNPNWINSSEMLIWPVYRVFLIVENRSINHLYHNNYYYYFIKENISVQINIYE